MSKVDDISTAFEALGNTLKSVAKVLLQSRRCDVGAEARPENDSIIIMGNGPSLSDTIATYGDVLRTHTTLAVNYAANAEEFFDLKPRYYVMVDPAFFDPNPGENLKRLRETFAKRVDWPMTIFVPAVNRGSFDLQGNPNVTVRTINSVGLEGFGWFERMAYGRRWGTPRPRNVLIPSIMVAIWLGFKKIYLVGADHSWMRTLEVNEQNEVVSVQPHFYKDNESARKWNAAIFKTVRLHEVVHSYYVAFKAYFSIKKFADSKNVMIYNSTPGSFIDAFPRKSLADLPVG
ncbi:MAG: DUF115 domain-containing protein [Muribaculaceae bacterium]|nr:DUF115 domain-containing protein [Muribaculaceae bacterium]